MNFFSPFAFSLYQTDALIFKHKAIWFDEGGGEKERTAGILTCFTGLLGTFEVLFVLPPEKGGPGQGLLIFCFSLWHCNSIRFLGKDSAYYFCFCHWKFFKCYTKSQKSKWDRAILHILNPSTTIMLM